MVNGNLIAGDGFEQAYRNKTLGEYPPLNSLLIGRETLVYLTKSRRRTIGDGCGKARETDGALASDIRHSAPALGHPTILLGLAGRVELRSNDAFNVRSSMRPGH